MDIRVIDRTGQGDGGLVDHARWRLSCRLGHRSDHLVFVSVGLGGTASPRGRHDMYCVMHVQPRGARSATVVDIGADALATIDRAAERVCRLTDAHLRLGDGGHRTAASAKEMAA